MRKPTKRARRPRSRSSRSKASPPRKRKPRGRRVKRQAQAQGSQQKSPTQKDVSAQVEKILQIQGTIENDLNKILEYAGLTQKDLKKDPPPWYKAGKYRDLVKKYQNQIDKLGKRVDEIKDDIPDKGDLEKIIDAQKKIESAYNNLVKRYTKLIINIIDDDGDFYVVSGTHCKVEEKFSNFDDNKEAQIRIDCSESGKGDIKVFGQILPFDKKRP
jgi:hypothetical protein